MNLTQVVSETGRRVRRGRLPADRLSNAQVKQVLETAFAVMGEALQTEGRVEVQGRFVVERVVTAVKQVRLNGRLTSGKRTRYVLRIR